MIRDSSKNRRDKDEKMKEQVSMLKRKDTPVSRIKTRTASTSPKCTPERKNATTVSSDTTQKKFKSKISVRINNPTGRVLTKNKAETKIPISERGGRNKSSENAKESKQSQPNEVLDSAGKGKTQSNVEVGNESLEITKNTGNVEVKQESNEPEKTMTQNQDEVWSSNLEKVEKIERLEKYLRPTSRTQSEENRKVETDFETKIRPLSQKELRNLISINSLPDRTVTARPRSSLIDSIQSLSNDQTEGDLNKQRMKSIGNDGRDCMIEEPLTFNIESYIDNIAFTRPIVDTQVMDTTWPNDVKLYEPNLEQILMYEYADCLAAEAYLNICGLRYEVVHRKNSEFISPSSRTPFIKCGSFIISEIVPIIDVVKYKLGMKKNLREDLMKLLPKIQFMFLHAEMYLCWMDKSIRNNYTKPRYLNCSVFPLSYILLWKKERTEYRYLKMQKWTKKNTQNVLNEIEGLMNLISYKLGDETFLGGQEYCVLDIIVYAHIFALLSADLPIKFQNLQTIILNNANVMNLFYKMDKLCFSGKESKLYDQGSKNLQSKGLLSDNWMKKPSSVFNIDQISDEFILNKAVSVLYQKEMMISG